MIPFPFSGKPLVGVVHLPPLPGSPRWRATGRPPVVALCDRAAAAAKAFVEAGFDSVIVENFGDAPFWKTVPPETTAALTLVTRAVVDAIRPAPVGVNVLRNDGRAALAVAVAAGARFVRVNVLAGVAATDQGMIEGDAAALLRARDALGAGGDVPASAVAVWADVHVKHAETLHSSDVERAATDLVQRALADVVLVPGVATGEAPDADRVARAARGAGPAPALIASGLTPETCATLVPHAAGAIVASYVLQGGKAGGPIDPARARALVRAFRAASAVKGHGGAKKKKR
jgi:membrane complex biogenesis BtpA family protein